MKGFQRITIETDTNCDTGEFRRILRAILPAVNRETYSDMATALEEAITNVIYHAYPDEIGKFKVTMKVYPGNVIEVVVQDWGQGIENIEQARKPLFTSGNENRSGMGFTIMESFVDKVTVQSQPGKGTRVCLKNKFKEKLSYD